MKKYDIERIIEKVEKYKDMDLNDVNPYVFKVNGHLVQIGFTNNGKTAEDCLTNVLESLYK